MTAGPRPTTRCIIYTRKSSEEGLEMSFNSLDAQREACQAFIASQRQEGWRALPSLYDDGGYSGGSKDIVEPHPSSCVCKLVLYVYLQRCRNRHGHANDC